jgi:hypothetical protein
VLGGDDDRRGFADPVEQRLRARLGIAPVEHAHRRRAGDHEQRGDPGGPRVADDVRGERLAPDHDRVRRPASGGELEEPPDLRALARSVLRPGGPVRRVLLVGHREASDLEAVGARLVGVGRPVRDRRDRPHAVPALGQPGEQHVGHQRRATLVRGEGPDVEDVERGRAHTRDSTPRA